MRAHRGRRPGVQPKTRMDFNMRELAGDLAQMRVEAGIATFFFPRRVDLTGGVTEYRAETMLDTHPYAKFFFNGIDGCLRDVSPDAQDVRKMFDLDNAHDRTPQFWHICERRH